MKLAISLLVTLFASIAFACPNLTGKYLCTQDGEQGTENVVLAMTQAVENNVTTYTAKFGNFEEKMIADGVERRSESKEKDEEGNEYTLINKETWNCTGENSLIGQFTSSFDDSQYEYPSTQTVSLTTEGHLKIVDTYRPGSDQTIDEESICQRIP